MQHGFYRAGDFDVARNIVTDKTEFGIRKQVRDICVRAGDEVVHAEHVPAAFDQQVAEMRPQKASSSGDDSAQVTAPFA